MALVSALSLLKQQSFRVHPTVVECRYGVFTAGAAKYVQLNTYGSSDRQDVDTVSQTLQFDETSARELMRLLEQSFPS